MTRTERSAEAVELLSFVRSYAQADLPTRLHAAQLLEQLQGWKEPMPAETAPASEHLQSIEQLALQMLAVRLA